jgi:hypothetical protein
MPPDPSRTPHERWGDIEGTNLALFCGVEQIRKDPQRGGLLSRLHQRGPVLRRERDVLGVRVDAEGRLISVSPPLLHLLPNGSNGARW